MFVVTDTKLSRDFFRETTYEIFKDWSFYDGRSVLLYIEKHFEKHAQFSMSVLNLVTHVDTLLQIRESRQQTSRVRSDRVVSVPEHIQINLETDRIDRWRIDSVVSDDALVRGARDLMSLSDVYLVNRAVDDMLPSSVTKPLFHSIFD